MQSEDARTAMMLYRLHREEWEGSLLQAKQLAREKALAAPISITDTTDIASKLI